MKPYMSHYPQHIPIDKEKKLLKVLIKCKTTPLSLSLPLSGHSLKLKIVGVGEGTSKENMDKKGFVTISNGKEHLKKK